VLPITAVRASPTYIRHNSFRGSTTMSQKSKIFSCPTTRNVVQWLRHVPSHEGTMLGVPELSAVSCSTSDTGPGRSFWQS
jgi:hypothetical protein